MDVATGNETPPEAVMWDTVETSNVRLSHDRPCELCGHAAHTFLPCSDTCSCAPQGAPNPTLAA